MPVFKYRTSGTYVIASQGTGTGDAGYQVIVTPKEGWTGSVTLKQNTAPAGSTPVYVSVPYQNADTAVEVAAGTAITTDAAVIVSPTAGDLIAVVTVPAGAVNISVNPATLGVTNNELRDAFIAAGYDTAGQDTTEAMLSVAVADMLGTSFNVKAFGATGDGVTDDTVAIQDALDAAGAVGGGTVLLPEGSYLLTVALTVPDNVALQGVGYASQLIQGGTVACITAIGTAATAASITVDATVRSTTVAMSAEDGDQFTAGTYAILRSTEAVPNSTSSATYGEMVCVASESAGVVTLDGPINHGYTTANNAALQRITMRRNVQIRNLRITNPAPNTKSAPAILFRYALEPRVENIWGDGLDGALVNVQHTAGGIVSNVYGVDLTDDAGNARLGYVASVAGAVTGMRLDNLHGERCRHVFTTSGTGASGALAGIPYGIVVSNSTARSSSKAGFDTHAEGDGIAFVNCTVIGSKAEGFQLRGFRNRIVNCQSYGALASGFVLLENANGSSLQNCIALDTRTSGGSGFGYQAVVGDLTFIGCEARGNERQGFSFSAGRVRMLGCTSLGNNLTGATLDEINVGSSVTSIVITGGEFGASTNVIRFGSSATTLSLTSALVRDITNLFGGATRPTVSVIRDNIGYVTEANGTATVLNATTSIAVTHGLGVTPAIEDISVTPTNSLGTATKFWISAPTSTQFTINVDADPGATTATFVWQASIQ